MDSWPTYPGQLSDAQFYTFKKILALIKEGGYWHLYTGYTAAPGCIAVNFIDGRKLHIGPNGSSAWESPDGTDGITGNSQDSVLGGSPVLSPTDNPRIQGDDRASQEQG